MTWQRRLIELACAGGTLAGCSHDPNVCGNANPDPCICGRTADPAHDPQCIAEEACRDNGGEWVFVTEPVPEAGIQLFGQCESATGDAGTDAPHD